MVRTTNGQVIFVASKSHRSISNYEADISNVISIKEVAIYPEDSFLIDELNH